MTTRAVSNAPILAEIEVVDIYLESSVPNCTGFYRNPDFEPL